jgi:hypothetical protein
MKRIAVLALLTLFIASNVSSQFRFGLRGGINMAYFDATRIEEPGLIIETLDDATIGYHIGGMVQISFFGIFLQPELLYSTVGSEVRITDNGSRIREQTFNKLDFPVLIGKRLGPVRLGIGPVGTIILDTRSELREETATTIREDFNRATFGYQLGAGLDIGFIALDLKYEGNLTKLGSGIEVGGQRREFDTRGRQIIFGVGILF